MFDYQLIRSRNRKSVALQVSAGQVLVRAPYGVSPKRIDVFVNNKQQWIAEKLQRYALVSETLRDNQIVIKNNGILWLKGQKLPLLVRFSDKNDVIVRKDAVEVTLSKRYLSANEQACWVKVKSVLENWFKQQANEVIRQKLPYFIAQTKLSPNAIKIRQYKARWGSCDNKGQLSFNYLLMMVPESVLDYVIIHELCHLKYFNHSTHFWQLVARYCPDYRWAKTWLKQHQPFLTWPKID
ncbi:SprT family zinc-dependent metalloprotease [Thalassotalea sp. G2M2-11]|uniref:M48 family metallopeptidase n=1 Tax=Thalassotalea sp. G2M2-11 TaxID=2787627 RepID=UPI0019D16B67|nr:SprT family zinc-dependent metalloprotease [Thalassotalea sp. G2M2-11]